MKTVGETLRQAREARGLRIEDIAHATKLSRTTVTAIEAGAREQLPADVYMRGFVRSYATLVGLDGAALLRDADERARANAPGRGRDRSSGRAQLRGDVQAGQAMAGRRVRVSHVVLLMVALGMFLTAWFTVGSKADSRGAGSDPPVVRPVLERAVDGASNLTRAAAPVEE